MSDHTSAFVPVEAWTYSSPDIRLKGGSVDVGLLAEALIYYDRVIVNVSNQPQFAEFLTWFLQQDRFNDFLHLVDEGIIQIYDYSFSSVPIKMPDGTYNLMNVQDEVQARPDTFEERVLAHSSVRDLLNSRQRVRLYQTFRGRVIEVKADEYGAGVKDAIETLQDPERCSRIVQAFVDDLYPILGRQNVPEIKASVETLAGGGQKIHWGIDLNELGRLAGPQIRFHRSSPLSAATSANRFLWSAAKLNCDLYLGSPISAVLGDKLQESSMKLGQTIDDLQARVEFPDIRQLVNEKGLDLETVLKVRQRGDRFRTWLQQESERDRDAILAYHYEVARESGLQQTGRKVLRLFGDFGGVALGAAVGGTIAGPPGAVAGAAAGRAVGFTFDVASRLGEGWKPVIFGDWMRDRVTRGSQPR